MMKQKYFPLHCVNEAFLHLEQMPVYHYTLQRLWQNHSHDFYEIELILSGKGIHRLNGTETELLPGKLCFITPGDVHEVECNEPLELAGLHFHQSCMDRELYSQISGLPAQTIALPESVFFLLSEEFFRLKKQKEQEGAYRSLFMKNSLERILLYLLEQSIPVSESKPRMGVYAALGYIDRHFREPISLERAAEISHLSPSYFSRRFCREVGMTFEKYLVFKRLEFAKHLLTAANVSVSQVCFECGFQNVTHFSRSFKRMYGQTPGSMKQNRKKDEQ